MLYDSQQVVDAEAALEFMKEATKLASTTELEDVGQRLEEKHLGFRGVLGEREIAALDEAGVKRFLGSIFTLKKKSRRLLAAHGLEPLRRDLTALLHGPGTPGERLDAFVAGLGGIDRATAVALAGEALHFYDPRRHWLWTYWIWNPEARTGALPLVTQEGVDLAGETPGEIYEKVGHAMALVDAQGHAVGYSRSGRGPFGTDVFLAAVYAVYMYTVFKMKLSQEFNRILPELPELVQRVLGVHRRTREKEATHV